MLMASELICEILKIIHFRNQKMKNLIFIIFSTALLVGCTSDVEKCVNANVVSRTTDSSTDKEIKELRGRAYIACLNAAKGG